MLTTIGRRATGAGYAGVIDRLPTGRNRSEALEIGQANLHLDRTGRQPTARRHVRHLARGEASVDHAVFGAVGGSQQQPGENQVGLAASQVGRLCRGDNDVNADGGPVLQQRVEALEQPAHLDALGDFSERGVVVDEQHRPRCVTADRSPA